MSCFVPHCAPQPCQRFVQICWSFQKWASWDGVCEQAVPLVAFPAKLSLIAVPLIRTSHVSQAERRSGFRALLRH